MIMIATVLRVEGRGLLVRDSATGQEVFVNFGNPRAFRAGDVVRITYTGQMTPSIPPQIIATSVVRVNQPQPQPQPQPSQTEIRRALIQRISNNVLYVRNPSNGQQVIVNYPYAHHFCVGQRVNIRFDSIILSNPQQVNATDVRPIC